MIDILFILTRDYKNQYRSHRVNDPCSDKQQERNIKCKTVYTSLLEKSHKNAQ